MAARRARSAALLLLLLQPACGAKARDARPLPPVPSSTATGMHAAVEATPAPALASLDALASRQVRLAPGMREILRGETATSLPLPKVSRDTCVRVAFAAAPHASLSLVTKDGARIWGPASGEGALGDRGPVCFHAETEPRVEVSGDAGVARVVMWAAE